VKNHATANFLYAIALAAMMWQGGTVAAEEVEGLPRYYTFFMKQADQIRLPEESERDVLIEQGKLRPISVDSPLPDWVLPDGFGNNIALRDYIGKKNVVLSTMRTWW
jgi:hypothetical protein